MPTIMAKERSTMSATISPRRTPAARNACASRFARSLSSAYVSDERPSALSWSQKTAVADGFFATCASISS